MPWGFNHWAPQSRMSGGSWWFNGNDHSFHWIRCTHQPSPWIGDYGWFLLGPQMGSGIPSEHFWEPRGSVIKPHLFDATLAPWGIRLELAPTMHGAIVRASFPSSSQPRYMCFAEAEWTSRDSSRIVGISRKVSIDRLPVVSFGLHILITSDQPTMKATDGAKNCFQYDSSVEEVTIRISTSLIGRDFAQVAMNRELPQSKSFDDIAKEAKAEWNKMLKKVDVLDAGEMSEESMKHLSVFYTCLYRALTFPRRTDELSSDGRVVHYSPYSNQGGQHDGPGVTDNGFWDTFRTVYPLLSLIYPDYLGEIIQGWLNAFKEGGWLPSWASPGYRNCMVGTFADVVVADAIVKGIRGFDLMTAYQALYKGVVHVLLPEMIK